METIKISFLHVFTIKTGTMIFTWVYYYDYYDEYFLHVFTIETITISFYICYTNGYIAITLGINVIPRN